MSKFVFYTHLHNITGQHFWTGGLVDAERSMDDLLLRLTEQLAKSNMRPIVWLPQPELSGAWFVYEFGPLGGIGRVSRSESPPTRPLRGYGATAVYRQVMAEGRDLRG